MTTRTPQDSLDKMTKRSLYEIYSIGLMDLIMDDGRKLKKYSETERKMRKELHAIEDQHQQWREHCLTNPRLRHHEGDDGDPTHTSHEEWVEFVKKYRDNWWREKFCCYFNPMCTCESVEPCGCRPFANGVILIEGKTEIEGTLSRELQEMYRVKPTIKPSPPPPGYYSCPGCNVFVQEIFTKCPLCQKSKFSTNVNI